MGRCRTSPNPWPLHSWPGCLTTAAWRYRCSWCWGGIWLPPASPRRAWRGLITPVVPSPNGLCAWWCRMRWRWCFRCWCRRWCAPAWTTPRCPTRPAWRSWWPMRCCCKTSWAKMPCLQASGMWPLTFSFLRWWCWCWRRCGRCPGRGRSATQPLWPSWGLRRARLRRSGPSTAWAGWTCGRFIFWARMGSA